jgi:putative transcriptional regulator
MLDISTPPPTPDEIRAARKAAGLTQPAMAAIIGLTGKRAIQEWESGRDPAKVALWELFLLKTDQHPTHAITAR